MCRGLTLIEALMAVTLSALIVLAAAAWLQLASDASRVSIPAERWLSCADAALQRMHDDVVSGDVEQPEPLIDDAGGLRIPTRLPGIGSTLVRFTHDPGQGAVRRSVGATGAAVPILLNVEAWRVQIDLEGRVLTAEIISSWGQRIGREVSVP